MKKYVLLQLIFFCSISLLCNAAELQEKALTNEKADEIVSEEQQHELLARTCATDNVELARILWNSGFRFISSKLENVLGIAIQKDSRKILEFLIISNPTSDFKTKFLSQVWCLRTQDADFSSWLDKIVPEGYWHDASIAWFSGPI